MKVRRSTVATKERPPTPVLHFGAGRGSRLGLSAYEEFNASSAVGAAPTFVDAQPGAALTLVRDAKTRGITAQAIEARVEDMLPELREATDFPCIVVALDHGEAIATVIENAPESSTVIGSLVLKLPEEQLLGLSFCLGPHDLALRPIVARLFREIGSLTLPRGSEALFGASGDPTERAGEPVLRAALAARLSSILRKSVARLKPEVSPLEMTVDMGGSSMPVFVVESGEHFQSAQALAHSTVEQVAVPLRRGEPFAVIEIAGRALRFHVCRLRTDGRIVVEGGTELDEGSVARLAEEEAAATRAIARAQAATIAMSNPLLTSD